MATPMKWLHSFEAVARLGSMTLAAQEVGLTQAALSQQMQALETQLKLQLFNREPRGVSLTPAGARFYSDISPGLEQIGNALKRYRQPRSSRLRILSNASFALRWLFPNLPRFQAGHPAIQVEVRTALWRPEHHGYGPDAEIFLGGPVRPAPARAIVRCQLVAVRAAASPEDPGDAPLPVIRISGQESLFEEWLKTPYFAGRTVRQDIEVDSVHAAVSLAAAGAGWTLSPSFLVQADVQAGRLCTAAAGITSPKRAYWMQLKDSPSAAAEAFRDWIAGEMAQAGQGAG
ncbi:LysR family transcriptional regulator [Leisingera thetidis]|uniref:LysR family transcriptional regulator n=1 Tax=Leisingera thetidis TaxID=2930199 RepID=UPI0021F80060|nr:LysR family transcriptional regulator [Leisingera thetidis]